MMDPVALRDVINSQQLNSISMLNRQVESTSQQVSELDRLSNKLIALSSKNNKAQREIQRLKDKNDKMQKLLSENAISLLEDDSVIISEDDHTMVSEKSRYSLGMEEEHNYYRLQRSSSTALNNNKYLPLNSIQETSESQSSSQMH